MTSPRDIRRGEPILASWLNAAKNAALNAIRVEIGSGLTLRQVGGNVTIGLDRPQIVGSGGAMIGIFRVESVRDNYLTCRRVADDGSVDEESSTIAVAKPLEVRKSRYANETTTDPLDSAESLTYSYTSAQERTVTKSSDDSTEDQRIVPWYAPGTTIIQAVRQAAIVVDDDGNDLRVDWQEIGPRAWAKVAE